jgi:hypothetical protein
MIDDEWMMNDERMMIDWVMMDDKIYCMCRIIMIDEWRLDFCMWKILCWYMVDEWWLMNDE